ncbi:MAG: hypothetical protein HW405_606, partial [Candidatus Berkelbacteria bacterium]|nr:hypothetical protein [Candidatus Berkelbacteria bacterium]
MTKIERIRKKILSIIFWGFLFVSFVFFATLIILKANGYQLNWNNWNIIETGMIVIDGQPKDVDIKMNQKYFKNLPEQFS